MRTAPLLLVLLSGPLALAAESPPWGNGETPSEQKTLEKTAVCTDGKSHYVIVAPHDKQLTQLYYGDGKLFHRVPLPPWVLTGETNIGLCGLLYYPDSRGDQRGTVSGQ